MKSARLVERPSLSAEIDWEKLAAELGPLTADGESGGSGQARRALEFIVGEDALRASVDHYIADHRGFELARSVLWQLRPWSAMRYCYEIFKGSSRLAARRAAVELLLVIGDRRALPWIPEFLDDNDPDIQKCGIGLLDQFLFFELTRPEEAEVLLKMAEQHHSDRAREEAERIRRDLRARAQMDERRSPENG
jgi:hypothetical protein